MDGLSKGTIMSSTKNETDKEKWGKGSRAPFKRAIDAAAKSQPNHGGRPKRDERKERPSSKGRVHKGRSRA